MTKGLLSYSNNERVLKATTAQAKRSKQPTSRSRTAVRRFGQSNHRLRRCIDKASFTQPRMAPPPHN